MKDLYEMRINILKKRKLQFDIKKLREAYEKDPAPFLKDEILEKSRELSNLLIA